MFEFFQHDIYILSQVLDVMKSKQTLLILIRRSEEISGMSAKNYRLRFPIKCYVPDLTPGNL